MKHEFNVMSVKTANKDGKKYLGKNGTQAWRVSIKVGEEWYGNMVWEEDMLPKKGTSYEIELSENDGFKNWDFKLLTKKEQILEQTQPVTHTSPTQTFTGTPTHPTKVEVSVDGEPKMYTPKDPYQEKMSRGAAWNNAFAWALKNNYHNACGEDIDKFCAEVAQFAEQIAPHQEKFVQGTN